VVRCELDNGAVGWGEGLPRVYVTGETIDNVWSLLSVRDLVQQLAEPFENLAQAIKLADQFTLHVSGRECPFVERGCFGNSARDHKKRPDPFCFTPRTPTLILAAHHP
jgi:muconate cycloisomerase